MSSFNPAIPQANDRLAKSQQDLLKNNQQLDTSFGINHYAFSDLTANNGMHKQCQLVELANPVPAAGTDSIYCAKTGTPSVGELFYVRGGGGTPIQMTGPFDPVTSAKGYTFLPGGMLIQWGFINSTASTYTTLLFATNNINFPNRCRFVTTQPYAGAVVPSSQATVVIKDSTVSNTQFDWAFVTNSNQYTGFYWTAIGF